MTSRAPAGLARLQTSSRIQRDYKPIHWSEYFDEAHDVKIGDFRSNSSDAFANKPQEEDSFRVYLKNFQEPLAPRRKLGEQLEPEATNYDHNQLAGFSSQPSLVLLHGGGYSALTWAEFTRHIDAHCQARILAIDLRAHGDTRTCNESQMDAERLVSDVNGVIHATHRLCGFPETPKLVLVGHSMGGALAIKCASRCLEHLPSLAGFVVVDVVEGTAKEALPQMISVIQTRPRLFPSLPNAIEWCVRSGMAKSCEAARVSMPGNLVNLETGHLAIHDIPSNSTLSLKKHKFAVALPTAANANQSPSRARASCPRVAALKNSMLPPPVPVALNRLAYNERDAIQEEETVEESCKSEEKHPEEQPDRNATEGYTWRTNLAKTQPFWNGWFEGLSGELLTAPVQGKLLLLAGIDRLDKTLTIGQMQGKFMMKVLPKCGHAVHEDVPEQVAAVIGDFLVRNKFATPPPETSATL